MVRAYPSGFLVERQECSLGRLQVRAAGVNHTPVIRAVSNPHVHFVMEEINDLLYKISKTQFSLQIWLKLGC